MDSHFLFDLHFQYENEDQVRPYVVNADISLVGDYTQRVANLCEVAEIFVRIHPSSSFCEFHEFTI